MNSCKLLKFRKLKNKFKNENLAKGEMQHGTCTVIEDKLSDAAS